MTDDTISNDLGNKRNNNCIENKLKLRKNIIKKKVALTSVVRVSNMRVSNNVSIVDKGSGVFIKDEKDNFYVLTAAHLFRNGVGKVIVQLVTQNLVFPLFLWKDDNADIALLALLNKDKETLTNIIPMEFSALYPKVNDTLYISGFGTNGIHNTYECCMLGYVKKAEFGEYDTMKLSCRVQQGDSGGPVYDGSNKLIGLVWGTDGTSSYASYNLKIMAVISAHCPSFFTEASNQLKLFPKYERKRLFNFDNERQNCGNLIVNTLKKVWINIICLDVCSLLISVLLSIYYIRYRLKCKTKEMSIK